MILSGLLGCLAGLLLAGRFKILATVPVQVVALLAFAVPALVGEASLGRQFVVWIVFSLTLQAAYVARLAMSPRTGQPVSARPRNA